MATKKKAKSKEESRWITAQELAKLWTKEFNSNFHPITIHRWRRKGSFYEEDIKQLSYIKIFFRYNKELGYPRIKDHWK